MVVVVETVHALTDLDARTVQHTNNPGNATILYGPLPLPAPTIFLVDEGNIEDIGGTRQVRKGSLMVHKQGNDVYFVETAKPIVIH